MFYCSKSIFSLSLSLYLKCCISCPISLKPPSWKAPSALIFQLAQRKQDQKNTGYAPQPKVLNIMTALEKMPVTNIWSTIRSRATDFCRSFYIVTTYIWMCNVKKLKTQVSYVALKHKMWPTPIPSLLVSSPSLYSFCMPPSIMTFMSNNNVTGNKSKQDMSHTNPSFHSLPIIFIRVAGGLELIPVTMGWDAGYTLDRSPVRGRA